MYLQKIIVVKNDTIDDTMEIRVVEINLKNKLKWDRIASKVSKVNGYSMNNERDINNAFDFIEVENIGDGVEICYNVKLGAFSYNYSELYENFTTMRELYESMGKLSLEENNDIIYSAYVEELYQWSPDCENDSRNDYIADVNHSYYSGIGKIQ